ncbi:GntR family transcriptional regulator [Anaerotignum sp. MSJ-24]|uniref:GntR family transcriptional regulator n=1 Tax=Anaerotignum sp. MSJ-24 TaxID=2841521 RepID=UPI001C1245BB|nr:GntR family transcriptional regulator [Anaerotignum sp. MSJ-24]
MNIVISNKDDRPIYEQITSQMKNMILSGKLEEGSQLPSIRALAKDLRISVITTKRAYEELERDGFIITVAGKGSYVAENNSAVLKEEKMKQLEENVRRLIEEAYNSGISKKEVKEIFDICLEEYR